MHRSLTKKWAGIDFKVWLSLIVLAFLSTGLLAYKVATNVPCPNFSISAAGKLNHIENDSKQTFYINEQITFSASNTSKSINILWEFDDGSEKDQAM
ncbi:hypothetical protein [Niabella ginsengisoli]|uniref:PKD domain-containing protein n=1 Tax=Niabella ginsengisoli TaxID=522298 RepID=A0ABS9SGS2_9BACT|nr:hypothetical protein [Niabella ginsengisoli]MCH5597545.1 hypothetical protein [Niabella ginsengisoli]